MKSSYSAQTVFAPRSSGIGRVFAERYQIEGLLGEGGVGRVYKARHTRMSRRYAVKIPYGELAYDPKVRARFTNEAEAASRLTHPNVIGVIDFGETPTGLLYMAMDYAEGQSLAALIADNGALERGWVIRFTRAIAEGLAHAHDRGLVHRDLKPDNIIIERDGDRPRIVDFGLAIFREQEGGRLTTDGTVLGTPHYMAPEQATGQDIDQRTDLFALGLCMYEMLAGVLPFEGTPVQVARKNLASPVPLIAERVPGLHVDAGLEALVNHLLAKRPDDRPASAHVVIDLLDRLEQDGDVGTWKIDPLTPVPPAEPARARMLLEPSSPTPIAAVVPASAPTASVRREVPTTDTFARLASARRRRVVMLAAVIAVAGAILIGWTVFGGGRATTATTTTTDARAVALVPVDAPPPTIDAVVAIASVADAPPAAPDARATVAIRARPDARIATPMPDAGAGAADHVDARPLAPSIDAAPPPPPQTTVIALYKKVRAAIDALAAAKGEAAARAFRARWSDVPYLDGMGNASLRPDLITRLRAIERDVAAAMK